MRSHNINLNYAPAHYHYNYGLILLAPTSSPQGKLVQAKYYETTLMIDPSDTEDGN